MKKLLVKFHWDCGRQGNVNGLFVTTAEEISKVIGQHVYFGEALGKHSDINGPLEASDFIEVCSDQDFITKLVHYLESDTISGYNPFHYMEE